MKKTLYHTLLLSAVLMIVLVGVLRLSPTELHAQTPPYWGVERNASNNLNFYLNSSGTNGPVAMTILNNGNVGVGVTDPSAKFQVSGGTSGTGGVRIAGSGALGAVIYPGVQNGNIRITDDSTLATRGMTIANGGLVGIGTATPGQRLQVGSSSGGAMEGSIRTSTNNNAGGSREWDFGAGITTFGNYGFNIKDTGMGAPALNIAYGTGNVGLGTTNPQGRLDLSSNGGSDGLVFLQQAENSQSIQGYIDGHWADRTTYAQGCCNALLLQPDIGSVGIGIPASLSAPYYPMNAKLDIQAGGDDTIPAIRMRQSNAPAYGFDLGIDNNVDGGLYFYGVNNSAQTLAMKIRRDNGRVGLRTAGSPQADLQIKQSTNSQYSGGIMLERADTGNVGALFLGGDNKMYLMATNGYLTVDYTSRLDVKGDTRIDYKLAVNGYEPAACGAGFGLCVGGPSGGQSVWNNTSDGRLKKNITPISNALEKVMALQGVYFDFIETDGVYKNLPKEHQLGYIAQQVEPILPEVVSTGGDGMKMMSYANITALLGEAMKEQQMQIEEQKTKNEEQSKQIQTLTEELELLKKEIKEMKK